LVTDEVIEWNQNRKTEIVSLKGWLKRDINPPQKLHAMNTQMVGWIVEIY